MRPAALPSMRRTICILPTPATTTCWRSLPLAPSRPSPASSTIPCLLRFGDTQGSVYIADSGNNRIVQVAAAGTASTFAKIIGPLAVAVDASGNVYVADASQIWSVASDGTAGSLIERTYFTRRHGIRIGWHVDDRGHGRQCHSPAQSISRNDSDCGHRHGWIFRRWRPGIGRPIERALRHRDRREWNSAGRRLG